MGGEITKDIRYALFCSRDLATGRWTSHPGRMVGGKPLTAEEEVRHVDPDLSLGFRACGLACERGSRPGTWIAKPLVPWLIGLPPVRPTRMIKAIAREGTGLLGQVRVTVVSGSGLVARFCPLIDYKTWHVRRSRLRPMFPGSRSLAAALCANSGKTPVERCSLSTSRC